MALTHQDDLRNALCALTTGRVDLGSANASGRVKFFDAAGAVCATIVLSNPAFQAPVAGIAMANATTDDASPTAGAIPVRYEVWNRDNVWVWRDAVGPGASLGAADTPIPPATPVSLNNFFYRAPL